MSRVRGHESSAQGTRGMVGGLSGGEKKVNWNARQTNGVLCKLLDEEEVPFNLAGDINSKGLCAAKVTFFGLPK